MEKKLAKKIKALTQKHCTRCGNCCINPGAVKIEEKTKKEAKKKGIKKCTAREGRTKEGFIINALMPSNAKEPIIIEIDDANPLFPLKLPTGFFTSMPEKDLLFYGNKNCPFLQECNFCEIHGKGSFPNTCSLYPARPYEEEGIIFLSTSCDMVNDPKIRKILLKEIKKSAGKKWKLKVGDK